VYLNSYQSASQVEYNTAVGQLSGIAQKRYLAALGKAKLMAFYAKRSIEQRLGQKLVDMRDPLPLVDAPQGWEGEICTMGGISNDSNDWVAQYGNGFIGDYVLRGGLAEGRPRRLFDGHRGAGAGTLISTMGIAEMAT
jgi:hypothetical protein